MSEDNSNDNTSITTSETHSTKRTKREEIFGFPKDDVILGVAAAGLGLAGLVGGKMIYDMIQNGQIQNPLAPQNSRISYSDVYEQQRQQQAYEAQQAAQAQAQAQQQQQPELDFQDPEGGDPNAQTMPAFAGFDDGEDGVSYSTTVRKPTSNSFNRINGGGS